MTGNSLLTLFIRCHKSVILLGTCLLWVIMHIEHIGSTSSRLSFKAHSKSEKKRFDNQNSQGSFISRILMFQLTY